MLAPTPLTIPLGRGARARAARPPEPDADVLALSAAGEPRPALERLMERHGEAVLGYCRAELGDPALAEDVRQQVFIEAFRDLATFAGRSTLRAWLLGIARHRVLDAIKRRRRSEAHLDHTAVPELVDPGPPAGDQLDAARLHERLARCLARLSQPMRTAVLLRYGQGLTYAEMSVICGDSAGTLQVRVARGLRRLRGLVTAHAGP